MQFRNDGKDEINILRNRFTKYLMVSISHRKAALLQKRNKLRTHEYSTDDWSHVQESCVADDILDSIDLPMQFENAVLQKALEGINNRDRYIFLMRVLEERDFSELAAELGLGYKGAAAAYYRVIRKIKDELGGGQHGL